MICGMPLGARPVTSEHMDARILHHGFVPLPAVFASASPPRILGLPVPGERVERGGSWKSKWSYCLHASHESTHLVHAHDVLS